MDGGAGQALSARAPSSSPPASTRTRPRWTPPSPTGWIACRCPPGGSAASRVCSSGPAGPRCSPAQCGVEFIWCGNMKPAAYPAKWTMERLGTPFGVLFHGGDLLILQHQVHQSLLKRRTARALLSSAAVLVANSQWTRERCLTLLSELEIEPGERPGAGRSARRGPRVLPARRGHRRACGRATASARAAGCSRSPASRGTRASTPRCGRSPGCGDRYPDLRYAVVGSGEELGALEAEARELGVGDRVRFLTDVPDRDLPAIYNCAEVYLGVSRLMEQRVEGFGISIAEASACGVAVVAGRSGGIPEAVRDGETGLLVDAESAEAVGDALGRLLDDAPLRARLGAAGRRAVETYYNWDRVAGDLARIGHEFAGAGGAGGGVLMVHSISRPAARRRVRQPVSHLAGAARAPTRSTSTGVSPTWSGGSACCSAATRRRESGCSTSAAWTGCSRCGSSRWARRRWATTSRPPRSRRPSSSAPPRRGRSSPRCRRGRASST